MDDCQAAWFDYRKDYEPGNNEQELRVAHKAFKAGWDAAKKGQEQTGPLR